MGAETGAESLAASVGVYSLTVNSGSFPQQCYMLRQCRLRLSARNCVLSIQRSLNLGRHVEQRRHLTFATKTSDNYTRVVQQTSLQLADSN